MRQALSRWHFHRAYSMKPKLEAWRHVVERRKPAPRSQRRWRWSPHLPWSMRLVHPLADHLTMLSSIDTSRLSSDRSKARLKPVPIRAEGPFRAWEAGSGGRIRTYDQVINSHPLYH